jgi:hypothetical protein
MTKTYKIQASYMTYVTLNVEAESIDEAWDIALNADGGDFKQVDNGDWNIDAVIEL